MATAKSDEVAGGTYDDHVLGRSRTRCLLEVFAAASDIISGITRDWGGIARTTGREIVINVEKYGSVAKKTRPTSFDHPRLLYKAVGEGNLLPRTETLLR